MGLFYSGAVERTGSAETVEIASTARRVRPRSTRSVRWPERTKPSSTPGTMTSPFSRAESPILPAGTRATIVSAGDRPAVEKAAASGYKALPQGPPGLRGTGVANLK